jgi:hypothetical protein
MNRITHLALSVFAVAFPAIAQETITGQWMIDQFPVDGKVQLTIHRSSPHSNMTSSSALAVDQLRGLTRAQMESSGATVRFEIVRNAGTLTCDGYFRSGNGAGPFAFAPNAAFVSEMQSASFAGLPAETVFSMAVHDVTTSFVRDLRGLGVQLRSAEQLIALRIHNVTIDYVRELQALGYNDLSAERLVSMRIHNVALEFVREMKTSGYSPTAEQLVTLRIHGATSEFVKQVKGLGLNPTVDQLITMRIHGVTPEYIQKMQGRGVRNLTVDQLVSLKIHGIVD